MTRNTSKLRLLRSFTRPLRGLSGFALGAVTALALVWAFTAYGQGSGPLLVRSQRQLPLDISVAVATGVTETVRATFTLDLSLSSQVVLSGTEVVSDSFQARARLLDPPGNAQVTFALGPTSPAGPASVEVRLPTPTRTPTPGPLTGTVLKTANLRAGPGTDYPILGQAKAGETVTLLGALADGSWYLLDSQRWIAAFLVERTPGALPAVTPVITPVIAPATTPESTPVPGPTASPTPQAVSPPASTPTPDAPTPEQAYVDALQAIVGGYVSGLSQFSGLAQEVSQDVTKVFDSGWRSQVAAAAALMETTSQQIRALEPPDSLTQAHALLLQAADLYDLAVSQALEGIDNLDKAKLLEAKSNVLAANQKMEAARSQIQAVVKPAKP